MRETSWRVGVPAKMVAVTAMAVVIAMLPVAMPSPATAAPSSTKALRGPTKVQWGQSVTLTGTPGKELFGNVVVLETVSKPAGVVLQRGFVSPEGTARLSTFMPIAGKQVLRMRVLDGRRTAWVSQPHAVSVFAGEYWVDQGQVAGATRMLGHASNADVGPKARGSRAHGRALTPRGVDDGDLEIELQDLAGAFRDGPEQAAEALDNVEVAASSFSWDAVKFYGTAFGGWFLATAAEWGVDTLLTSIVNYFSGGGSSNGGNGNNNNQDDALILAQLQALAAQMGDIENALSSLQQQVTAEYSQLNALEANNTCVTLLDEANQYVNTIELAQQNMQFVASPGWLQANQPADGSPTTSMRIIGNQVFGSGSGNPSFTTGVLTVQQAVTNLADLLLDDGAPGTTGLISACSSAISAQIAANPSPYMATGTSVLPVGAVDDAYFLALESIVGYYAGWISLGQTITAQGAEMTISLLSPQPPTSTAMLAQVCSGATAGTTSNLMTCSGLLAQIAQTKQTLSTAWTLTGASWGQVSEGLLGADTQVNAAQGSIAPPTALWPMDLALYGTNGAAANITPSTSQGNASAPAASIQQNGVLGVTGNSWMGLNFSPATSATWDRLLGVSALTPYPGATTPASSACQVPNSGLLTSCAAPMTVGGYMNAAGLQVAGAAPSNLILYTGETSTWTPLASAIVGDSRYFQYESYLNDWGGFYPDVDGPPLTVQSFLDSSLVPVQGASVVVGNPSTTVTTLSPSSIYPHYTAASGTGNFPVTLSTSAAATGPTTWWPANCPAEPAADNPYPAAPALNLGSLLGLANGATSQLSTPSNGGVACSNVLASKAGSVPLTSNSSFYPDLSAAGLYVVEGSDYYAGLSWNNTTTQWPGFVSSVSGTAVPPQGQYVWPVANPSNPGCGAMTSFDQGFNGTSHVTNTCANLFQEFAAVYYGVNTGPVTLTAPVNQATIQDDGSSSAIVLLNNSSDQSQNVSFTYAVTEGQATSGVPSVATGSAISSITCAPQPTSGSVLAPTWTPNQVVYGCSIAVSPGGSALTLPITWAPGANGASGQVSAAVSGVNMASASTFTITDTEASTMSVPAQVTGLAVTASTATSATLSWQTPSSVQPLTGYSLNVTNPAGANSTNPVAVSAVAQAGNISSTVVDLTTISGGVPPGYWQFALSGVNTAGNGLPGVATTYLGSGPPPAPANLTAVENPDSTVTLAWTPITAMPAVSNYSVVVVDPNGTPRKPVTVVVPGYTTPALGRTGTWTFQVTAQNTAGPSSPSIATVSMLGTAPSVPVNLGVTVSDSGLVSASWGAPESSIPPPQSYEVRVFSPDGKQARREQIDGAGLLRTVSIPGFFTLGSNSPAGLWTTIVRARNASGVGQSARSAFLVTASFLAALKQQQSIDSEIGQIPTLLSDIDASECRAGFDVSSSYGTCKHRLFTPTPR